MELLIEDSLYRHRLRISQAREFALPRPLRKLSIILAEKPEQQVGRPLRHVDDLAKTTPEAVMRDKEARFLWQVELDGLLDAGIKELRMRRGIEVAVYVRGLVEHPDIAAIRWLPADRRQKPPRHAFQHPAILADPGKDGGRHRKHHAGGLKPRSAST